MTFLLRALFLFQTLISLSNRRKSTPLPPKESVGTPSGAREPLLRDPGARAWTLTLSTNICDFTRKGPPTLETRLSHPSAP